MQVQKLPPRGPFDGLKSPNHVVLKERRGVWAFERPDQAPVYDVRSIMSNVIAGMAPSVRRLAVRENGPGGSPWSEIVYHKL
jgi:hypothetical protein